MAEEIKTQIRTEGENAFPTDPENDNSADSSSGKETGADDKGDENVPFHENPRWKKREEEWNSRFNEQEQRHQQSLKDIREEIAAKRETNTNQTKKPSWFGGSDEQWAEYRRDVEADLTRAEKQAEDRAYKRLQSEQTGQQKAQQEAEDFLNSEIDAIEASKELNPDSAKIDRAALLKFTLDNELVDTKGRWNYKAAFRLMRAQDAGNKQKNTDDRKKVAAATTSERKAEAKPATAKTSQDFKGNRRPW